jgi:nicotinate-nucleotide pyrophosphorylase (carboxylating)
VQSFFPDEGKGMQEQSLDLAIKHALAEDLCDDFSTGFGSLMDHDRASFLDVTSDAIFGNERADVRVVAKCEGVLSGLKPFRRVFAVVDPTVSIDIPMEDGHSFSSGDTVATLQGSVRSILVGERTALNFLGHLSGIASRVRELSDLLKGTDIRILDTRKTLPGLRSVEKEAVLHGGGVNHRMGLFDMVLIKDNHIDRAGSIEKAVRAVRNRHGNIFKIEVETRTLAEVQQALRSGVDRIMLDNMDEEAIGKACTYIDGRVEIEVSGNMDREKLIALRHLPVDFVSMGSITYAAGHADFSMMLSAT